MTWETYYDRFYDWADSTQISNISKLENFGPSAEVCEIALAYVDEKAATRLVKKALAAGVKFTAQEVVDLDGCVSDTLLPQLAKTAATAFTADELDTISLSLSAQELAFVARKSGLQLDEDGFVLPEPNELDAKADRLILELDMLEANRSTMNQTAEHKMKKSGWGTALLLLLGTAGGRDKQKHNKQSRSCDGDCENCPPHYGYRYGRWYYGHGHRYGCQRGGNGGATGKCRRD